MEKKLKHKFLDAVITGELGKHTDNGIIVMTKEFALFFGNAGKKDYLRSYLPSVTIEAGRSVMQHNKYLFKMALFHLCADIALSPLSICRFFIP